MTWCPLGYNEDTAVFAQELESVPDEYWHYDEYRNTKMLCLYNPSGRVGKFDINIKGENTWTEGAEYCPRLKEFLETVLEEVPGRVTILRTPPGYKMNTHIDSWIEESGTEQYKWRMVVKGDKHSLFFLDKNEQPVYPNAHGYQAYVMDGAHPHCINESENEKITVCIGAPWKGHTMPQNLITDEAVYISKPELRKEWECR